MKKFVLILFTLLLLCSTAIAEDGLVAWVDGGEKFIFEPGTFYSDSDMFEPFKNVMPGDVISQTIHVQNLTNNKMRIWMRVNGADEKSKDFLSQMTYTIEHNNKTIFNAPAHSKGQLAKETILGTFKGKGETELTVTLYVPADLGNEYMNNIGTLSWTFLAEDISDPPGPDTGDWFNVAVWGSVAALLVVAITVVLLLMKKRRREAE